MAFCGKCGAQVNDDVKFCPACGEKIPYMQGQTTAAADSINTAQVQVDPNDAEKNKLMAILAYILFFIPLLTGDHKKSPFVLFHTNQGTILFLTWLAAMVLSSLLTFVIIGFFLMPLLGIVCFIFCIMGIINAATGKMTPLPVIGKYKIVQ